MYLQSFGCGDHFGLESAAFQFVHHLVSVVSNGALQRNTIGVTTQTRMHVLVIPYTAIVEAQNAFSCAQAGKKPSVRNLRELAQAKPSCIRSFPFTYDPSIVEFLRHTFVFQSVKEKNLQFLAAHVRIISVSKQEYLFTAGQPAQVYIARSGQLKVFTPEEVRVRAKQEDENAESSQFLASLEHDSRTDWVVETRHVELEILQMHDLVGLMEACLTQPTFRTFCIASSQEVQVLTFPSFALFSVLSHEPTASQQVFENLKRHHTWYKLRRFTALNHHNKQKEFKLSLAVQRQGPIQCSRCGWTGHVSTSSICVRAESPKLAFVKHLTSNNNTIASFASGKRSLRTERRKSSMRDLLNATSDTLPHVKPSTAPETTTSASLDGSSSRKRGMEAGQHLQSLQMNPESLVRMFQDAAKKSQWNARSSLIMLSEKISVSGLPSLPSNEIMDDSLPVMSDLEQALERLDLALENTEPEPAMETIATPRPRTVPSLSPQPVGIVHVKEAAIQAVNRISATQSPPKRQESPRIPRPRFRKMAIMHP